MLLTQGRRRVCGGQKDAAELREKNGLEEKSMLAGENNAVWRLCVWEKGKKNDEHCVRLRGRRPRRRGRLLTRTRSRFFCWGCRESDSLHWGAFWRCRGPQCVLLGVQRHGKKERVSYSSFLPWAKMGIKLVLGVQEILLEM